jgi:hypothetical protein
MLPDGDIGSIVARIYFNCPASHCQTGDISYCFDSPCWTHMQDPLITNLPRWLSKKRVSVATQQQAARHHRA